MVTTEGKIKFDYSISTEERFALRNWFRGLSNLLMGVSRDLVSPENIISENFLALGFGEKVLNAKEFILFWESLVGDGIVVVRFPEFNFKKKLGKITGAGSLECFTDNMLTMEGTVELQIKQEAETEFKISNFNFFPRLLVRKNNVGV